jgi:glycosyltransferase involved in cell wall biosynthesis
LVSVVIPVFDNPLELKRAIQSVLNQTHQHFEILVMDDGSTMDIETVCSAFNDSRIQYIRNEQHHNANVARNTGLQLAKGEYTAMLDADDEYLPCHLERRLKKIKEWQCDGIHGSAIIDNGKARKVKISHPRKRRTSMLNYLLTDGFAPTPSHFYKTETARDIRWDESLERHQDYDFSIRYAQKYNFRCDYRPGIVVHWPYNKLRTDYFESQKQFLEKYQAHMSTSARINYLSLMKRKAITQGQLEQETFYNNQLHTIGSSFFIAGIKCLVQIKAKLRKGFYHLLVLTETT